MRHGRPRDATWVPLSISTLKRELGGAGGPEHLLELARLDVGAMIHAVIEGGLQDSLDQRLSQTGDECSRHVKVPKLFAQFAIFRGCRPLG
jgi:hypothetical protein